MSFPGMIQLSFNNRSSNGTLEVNKPPTNEGASVRHSDFITLPQTLQPNADTFKLSGELLLGLGGDADTAKITLPITIGNSSDSSKSVSGTMGMYCSGGDDYPDFFNVEIEIGTQSETHQLGLSAAAQALSDAPIYNMAVVNLLLNDSGLVLGIESDSYDLSSFSSAIQDIMEKAE